MVVASPGRLPPHSVIDSVLIGPVLQRPRGGCSAMASMSDTISDLVAVAGKVRADDRLVTDSGQQLAEIETVLDVITVLQSVVTDRVREAQLSEATAEQCGRSPKRWLVEDVLMAGPEASRYVNLAKWLTDFPLTREAFSTARISAAHAQAIVTALRWLSADYRAMLEPHVVERALVSPPEEIGPFVDALLEAVGLDTASDARRERRYAERGLDVGQTMDGQRSVAGTLTPEVGEKLEKALAIAAEKAGEHDERTLRQRQHDALGDIADAYLASVGEPACTGAPRTVIITMDLETLEGRLRDAWLSLPSGAQISPDTARRLACDAGIVPIVLGANGEILDIGKLDHEFTVAQRRAAWHRDGGKCAFPACRNRPGQLHHIIWRSRQGPTSLDNAAWLCHYHHWLTHEGGWTLERAPDRSYLWTGPHGQQRIRKLETARNLWTAEPSSPALPKDE